MVGIGFFAPLPLALMMPFMAGQSMLMGDAFGKAYQYGKRKISAMSNDEFNKLTPEQLGQEIVTDYSAMIPSLSVAIKQSSAFQSLIIQELASIIRSLPKDIVSGFTGESANPLTTIATQATSPADEIDYGKIAIATLKIMLGPIASNFNIPGFGSAEATSGTIQGNIVDLPPSTLGTPDPPHGDNILKQAFLNKISSYSDKTLLDMQSYTTLTTNEKKWARELYNSRNIQPAIKSYPGQADSSKSEALTWTAKRDKAITDLAYIKGIIIRLQKETKTNTTDYKNAVSNFKRHRSILISLSNDYRHSNNFIRTQSVILRQLISKGLGNTSFLY